MAIELVSTIKQKNNGQFPIAEANDIKGGYYSVASIEERDNIPLVRRTAGMLCYVLGDKIYKLIQNEYIVPFRVKYKKIKGGNFYENQKIFKSNGLYS